MATAVLEAVGKAVASVGTMWVYVGTPNMTGGGGTTPSDASAFSAPVLVVLNYIMWIGFAMAIVSVIALGGLLAARMRQGEGLASLGKLGLVLGGILIMSGGSAIVAKVLPSGPMGAGGAVAFLQGSLWWLMLAVAVGGVIIGGARMAFEQRAQPGKDVVVGLVRLIVVTGAGVALVGLLITAADSFSVWILNQALDCSVNEGDGTCFGRNITTLLALSTGSGGLGALLIIVLGIFAVIAAIFQVVLMIARGGMLVILTGILPISAAASVSGESGQAWFKKNIAWLGAFILYKPAAAIVYAAAFQLVGADVFKDDGSGLISALTGMMMMILALVAMPALMRFVTPMVGAMAGGAGGAALGAAAVASLPSGAASIGRMASGSGGGGGGSSAAPSGSGGSSAGGGGGGSHAASGGGSAGGGSAASVGGGSGAAAASGGAAAGGGAAAAGGGAAAAAGGGAAASGAAAGAAGGPVGIAAGAALGAAKQAGSAAKGAAEGIANNSTGEGPSGS
ncbi:hypothetical protein [Leucobacter sp. UCMA 4100]|uniref:hypothetical protein n=1 Tax=Leucobacter sp. UCMA 4100 TaxID=2810534 RepID=UPI0022EB495B|nr:hypothetical protein [Leucobacter sp. UCMA 4100]